MSRKIGILAGLLTSVCACNGFMPSGDPTSTAAGNHGSSTGAANTNPNNSAGTTPPGNGNTPVARASCTGAADGTTCDDHDGCTSQDVCQQGNCIGTALPGPCGKTLPVVALKGSAYYLYSLQATIGGQGPFNLVVDTGSPLLGVTQNTCTDCASRSPTYTPGAGATNAGKQLTQSYGCGVGSQGEGITGWVGDLVTDTIGLAGQKIPLPFAALTDGDPAGTDIPMFTCMDNGEANNGQGIIGMQVGTFQGARGFVDALSATKVVPDALALQLCDKGGRLWFGGYDPNFISAPPQFTPFVDVTSYQVTLNDITVAGKTIGVAQSAYGTTVVDCGTTRLTLPPAAFNALTAAVTADANFVGLFGQNFLSSKTCAAPAQAMTQAQLNAVLPPMALVFPNAQGGQPISLQLPATESYLTPDTSPNAPANSYCPGIESETGGNFSTVTLIGNTVMHTTVTIYDRTNKQMGFAPQAHCDTAATP